MRKTIIVFLILFGFFAIASEVSAALEVNWPISPLGTRLDENASLTVLIKYFYDWGIGLGGLAAFVALVIAGFQYLTSAGNPTRMKDAMDRIKSAGAGLLLLLASFLILNTINPQLTKLRMPEFPPLNESEWTVGFEVATTTQGGSCTGVQLYSGANYASGSEIGGIIGPGGEKDNITGGVKSVKFSPEKNSSCQLTLYRKTGFVTNSDNPSLIVTVSVPDMNLYGETDFRSAKVTSYQY
jgi:hypothetical protein